MSEKNIKNNGENGATLIVFVILLPVLIGFAAFAIDFGYRHVVRNELQNIADASALATAGELGKSYKGMTYTEQQDYVANRELLVGIAQTTASKNLGGNLPITIADSDVTIGKWDFESRTFKEITLNQPDAIRVVARRETGANSPIPTFFANIFGIESMEVRALATAALSGQSTADPGELELPVGISKFWFDEDYCNDHIKFYPTNDPDSCAGWDSFTNSPSNDSKLRDILGNSLLQPGDPGYEETLDSPFVQSGETEFEFIGGTMSNPTFDALLTAFQHLGYDVDANGVPVSSPAQAIPLYGENGTTPLYYPDGTARNRHIWETTVAVYDSNDCSNPNQSIVVEGFARVRITDVQDSPEKTIIGEVICDYVSPEDTRGGGGSFGTKGSIPGLVE